MIAVKRTVDPEEFARNLHKALIENNDLDKVHKIVVEPSVISESPHDYVVVYLTPDPDGKQLVISDAEELGEDGVFVGVHFVDRDRESDVDCVFSGVHALVWALERIEAEWCERNRGT